MEHDLKALNRLVEQLTTMARLEFADIAPTEPIQPGEMAEGVVSAIAPFVYASGKTIELIDNGGTSFHGHPALVENALRNLIENAVRHTGPGAAITVEIGPGGEIQVCDDGKISNSGRSSEASAGSSRGAGLGLRIVRRIAEIHGGSFELTKPSGGRTVARIVFASAKSR